MSDDQNLSPTDLFARLESEFRRVNTGVEALVEVDRLNAGPPPPGVPPPPNDSVNWDLGGVRIALKVLESLPDRAGKKAFVTAMIKAFKGELGDAGA